MKRLTATLVAALVVSSFTATASAQTTTTNAGPERLAPHVGATLASLVPAEVTTVIVTLRDKADLTGVKGATRAARLKAVITELQARADASQRPLRALLRLRAAQGKVAAVTPLWVLNAISVTATADVVQELAARSDVAGVTPDDVPVVPTAGPPEPNLAAVRAPGLWDLGYTGQGVVVANLDSGVDVSHPDLASRWRGGTDSWFDPYGQHPSTPTDLSGHGTATMGVMVGGDAGGTSIGVAPGARWIAAKIFNDSGAATATAVHQAFQWVLDPDLDPNTADAPQVVNNSWSLGSAPGCDLSFQSDVQALRAAGILPVFAAGNFGPGGSSSVSPANYPQSLAVGAVNSSTNLVYSASSRGPSTCGGRTTVFPDLVAPGVNILTTDRYGLYQTLSGTSLSAPHAAGALALLLSAMPGLSADQQQAALTSTAVDLGAAGPDSVYGNGRLDVLAAYQALQAQPDFTVGLAPAGASLVPGASAGFTVQVTPVNGFGGDVSLSLSGLTAAQAGWTFTPPVVPAGSGTSQLSVTTTSTILPGSYPLTVTGTNGTTSRTATATLTVTAPPDFTVTATPTSATVAPGQSADITIAVGSLNGFGDTVTLTADGPPAGVGTAILSPATIAGAGTAQLQLATQVGATGGSYPITVTATSGAITHAVPITLTVSAGDLAGPATTSPTLTPNLVNGAGTVGVAVHATGDDTASGGSNITAAEYTMDAGAAVPMTVNAAAPVAGLDATIDAPTVNALAEGTHLVSIRSQDAAGNWGAAVTVTLTVDRTGPTSSGVSAAPNPNNGTLPISTGNASVRVTATTLADPAAGGGSSAISAAEGFLDTVGTNGTGLVFAADDGTFDSPTEAAHSDIPLATIAQLTSGNHTIYVHAKDVAGNWGATATTVLLIDKTAPTFTGISLTLNPTNGAGTVTLTVNGATDPQVGGLASGVAGGEYWIGTTAPAPGGGTAFGGTTSTIPVSGLATGTYTIGARIRDAAGNWSAVTRSATVFVGPDAIFANGFETGTRPWGWSSASTTTTTRLDATAAAALVGTRGLQVQGNNTNYVQCNFGTATNPAWPTFDARFYFRPNGNTSTGKDILSAATANTFGSTVFRVRYRLNGTTPQVQIQVGTTNTNTTWTNVIGGASSNRIEVVWQSGSVLQLYVNGALSQALVAGTNSVGAVRLGSVTGNGNTTLMYFDAFASKRTASPLIGA